MATREARQRLNDLLAQHSHNLANPPDTDWVEEWRLVAQLTGGVSDQDPRFLKMADLTLDCTKAYEYNDVVTFRRITDELIELRNQREEEVN